MTAANKKFQQLKRKVHVIDAWKSSQEKEHVEKNPPFIGDQLCENCGFKARYKFLRCPQCNREQEEKK